MQQLFTINLGIKGYCSCCGKFKTLHKFELGSDGGGRVITGTNIKFRKFAGKFCGMVCFRYYHNVALHNEEIDLNLSLLRMQNLVAWYKMPPFKT